MLLSILFKFTYLFLRDSEWAGEEQRESRRENLKQALHCLRGAQRRVQTHELWDHDLNRNQESDAQPSQPLGSPVTVHFKEPPDTSVSMSLGKER